MGTTWIEKNLNYSKNIISIHGDKLAKIIKKNNLNYQNLANVFTEAMKNKHSKILFIHQPIKFSEKENYILKDNYQFLFLTRNPKNRTNTIISHYLWSYIFNKRAGYFARYQKSLFDNKVDLKEIFGIINKDIDNLFNIKKKNFFIYNFYYLMTSVKYSLTNRYFRNKIDTIDKSFIIKNKTFLSMIIINLFQFGIQSSLANDRMIIRYNLKYFVFEKLTNNKKEFLKLAKCIDLNYNETDINDDLFFKKIRSRNIKNEADKFWPESFKKYLKDSLDEKLNDFYIKNQY